MIIHSRNKTRNHALKIKERLGSNVDRYLVCSEWDYHKSRLNAFDRKDIMNIEDFNELCFKNGLDFTKIIELMKS